MAKLEISDAIAAFSEDQASTLTGLSVGRLRYWAQTGFFAPAYTDDAPGPYRRFYSFKDIVGLRTLEMLRVRNGVPLQHLRRVAEKLAHLREDLWCGVKLRVWDRKVVFDEPQSGRAREVISGQFVEEYLLKDVIARATADIRELRNRDENDVGKVVCITGLNGAKPLISGTRIPIASIQRLSSDGYSVKAIIAEYPRLTAEDVQAALRFQTDRAA